MRFGLRVAIALLAGSAAARAQLSSLPGPLALPQIPAAPEILNPRAVVSHTRVAPGQTFHVALDLRIAKTWAYYSPDPGDNGLVPVQPAELTVRAADLRVGPILWPKAKVYRAKVGQQVLVNNAFKGRTLIYAPLTVPADAAPGSRQLRFEFGGQVCGGAESVCISVSAPTPTVAVASVTVGRAAAANPQWRQDPQVRDGLSKARPATKDSRLDLTGATGAELSALGGLAVALLAGLILNIMPCVLPVIPLRILSLVQMAHESRRRIVTLGMAFAAGMLLFFVGLAAVNVVFRTALGRTVDLNEHFKLPPVQIAMALIVTALAGNLFGVFHVIVPSKIASLEPGHAAKEGHLKSLGMGLMMAVLATPCSFAILVGALTFAQNTTMLLGTLAILLIGVGMAAPHVLLAAFPSLLQRMPKPGVWMELFKQSMGFVLLGVAVWILSWLGKDRYPFWVAGYGVVLIFALWMWAHWVRYDAPLKRRLLVRGAAVALAVAGGIFMLRPSRPIATKFVPYAPGQIAAARSEGRAVLVEFTASWCTSCLFVEQGVYNSQTVADAIRRHNVLAVKADVTHKGTPAANFLEQLGGAPPLSVLYPPDPGARPIPFLGKFDKRDLLEALDKIKPGG